MKKISLLLLTFMIASSGLMAQVLPVNSSTNKVTYMEVVNAEGLTAKELYELGKEFAESKGWILVEDEAADNKVKYKAKIDLGWPGLSGGEIDKGYSEFTYTFDAKDGRYRFILTDFVHKGIDRSPDGGALENTKAECGPTRMSARGWVTIKEKTNEGANELTDELKQKIQEVKNDPERNDDW